MPTGLEAFGTGLVRGATSEIASGFKQREADKRKREREQSIALYYDISQNRNLTPEQQRQARGQIFAQTGQQVPTLKPPDTGIPYKSPEMKKMISDAIKVSGLSPDDPLILAEPTMDPKEFFLTLMNYPGLQSIDTMTDEQVAITAEGTGRTVEQQRARFQVSKKMGATGAQAWKYIRQPELAPKNKSNNLSKAVDIMTDQSGNQIPYAKLKPAQILELTDLGYTPNELKTAYQVATTNKTNIGNIMNLKGKISNQMIVGMRTAIQTAYEGAVLDATLNKTPAPDIRDFDFMWTEGLDRVVKFQEYNQLPPEDMERIDSLKDIVKTNSISQSDTQKYLEDWASKNVIPYEMIPFYIEKIYAE